jgi:hypothetical protein
LLVAGLFWEKNTVGWWLISQANRANRINILVLIRKEQWNGIVHGRTLCFPEFVRGCPAGLAEWNGRTWHKAKGLPAQHSQAYDLHPNFDRQSLWRPSACLETCRSEFESKKKQSSRHCWVNLTACLYQLELTVIWIGASIYYVGQDLTCHASLIELSICTYSYRKLVSN